MRSLINKHCIYNLHINSTLFNANKKSKRKTKAFVRLYNLNCFLFSWNFRIISSSELQFIASRHAAAIAAVAAASGAANPNGVGLSNSASGLNAPPPVPPSHQHDFHPAYRIPGYMEHLYSLQHASAASSSSLHGKNFTLFFFFFHI